jgi:hypothetical protein
MSKARCCWCSSGLVLADVLGVKAWLCPQAPCRSRQFAHALVVVEKGKKKARYIPLPSQVLFEECQAKNVLWGGQAGPGKSYGARWWLYKRSLMVPGHKALILRENWEQLDKTHLRDMEAEQGLIGARFSKTDRMMTFPNGSIIDCGHMADPDSVLRYRSTEYGAIVPDEASLYPLDYDGLSPLGALSTRARKVYTDVQGNTVRPRFMPVSNPGGPSAAWLRDMFVDHAPDYDKYPALKPRLDPETGEQKGYDPAKWAYIPARLDDNPYQDPEYEDTLSVLSKWQYEQLRHGDWHVFSGQFFSEWRESLHVRDLGALSPDLYWYEAMDWGYSSPGNVGWYAALPDGHYHKAAELKYQQMTADELATEIMRVRRRLGLSRVIYTVCDPSMDQKTGHGRGETYMESLRRRGIAARKGDNDRRNGWARVHALLRPAPDGVPWLTVDPSCKYTIRTIPAQMSDKQNPEDIDTHGDDHAADETRYFAQSRPAPSSFAPTVKKLHPMLEEALDASRTRQVLGSQNVRPRAS